MNNSDIALRIFVDFILECSESELRKIFTEEDIKLTAEKGKAIIRKAIEQYEQEKWRG